MYYEEIRKLQMSRPPSFNLSQTYLHPHENDFLAHILYGFNRPLLELGFRQLLEEALRRTPEALARAAMNWDDLSKRMFTSRGLAIPESSIFDNIQQELGIYGSTRYARGSRGVKRSSRDRLLDVLKRLLTIYPDWKWAERKYCYLRSAGYVNTYRPSC
jgi:hypothetical protein